MGKDKTSIGDRMKENYELRSKDKLLRKTPVIIRLDGKCFHSYKFHKPFDENLHRLMCFVASELINNIQGAKFAYTQSDEISILVTDFDRLESQAWFDYDKQKITSVSASIASGYFTYMKKMCGVNVGKYVVFDSRCFNLPIHEVNNYFVWRQKDWIRNSISMLARDFYSQKQIHGRPIGDLIMMLKNDKNVSWLDLHPKWRIGTVITREFEDVVKDSLYIGFDESKEFVKNMLLSEEEKPNSKHRKQMDIIYDLVDDSE